jgi:alpha-beta hydrolase superfamily lysophospholipase
MLIFPAWDAIVWSEYNFAGTRLNSVPSNKWDYQQITKNGITLNTLWIDRNISATSDYSSKVVLFCDGNRNNLYSSLKTGVTMRDMGLDYFCFEYRGYGLSFGLIKPTESSIYTDAKAAMDYLIDVKGYDVSDIIIVGYSLGTAVATNTAYEYTTSTVNKPNLLVLFAPIANAQILAREMSAGYNIPSTWYTAAKVDNLSKIMSITSPICIFHGTRDFVVPYRNSEYLFPAANEPKYFYTGIDDDHSFLRATSWWQQYFINFVANPLNP